MFNFQLMAGDAPALPTLLEIAGQSNGLGYGLSAADIPPHLQNPNGLTLIWDDGWKVMQPGSNTGTPANPGAWGPEVQAAYEWHQDNPGQVLYVVKSVKGSTGIAQDPDQLDWSPNSPGELYDIATVKFQAALQSVGGDANVVTMWMQGEQDAVELAKAEGYLGNASSLFEQIFANWGADQIVFGQISQELPFTNLVREAQEQLVDARTAMVDTTGFGLQADQLHFSADGQVALGAGMYQAAFEPEPCCYMPTEPVVFSFDLSGWAFW